MFFQSSRSLLFAILAVALACGGFSTHADSISPSRIVELRFDPGTVRWIASGDAFRAELENGIRAAIPGALDLPLVPVTVRPPRGSRLTGVEVLRVDWTPLTPPGTVSRFLPDGDGWSLVPAGPPAELLVSGRGGYARGERLEGLLTAPVQPGPGGTWRVAERLEVRLSFGPDHDLAEAVVPRRAPAGRAGFEPGGVMIDLAGPPAVLPLSASVPGAFAPEPSPSLDGSPVSQVIVTATELVAEFQRLADWRTRSGIPTVVRSMDWVLSNYRDGADSAENLRLFLRDAVTFWGTEAVLLGGDLPLLPARLARTTFFLGEDIPTDMYFQCLDGSWNANGNELFGEGERLPPFVFDADEVDLLPDLTIGRAPVSSVSEARVFVDKVLRYEIDPPVDNDYPASALLLAEVLFPPDWIEGGNMLLDGADLAESTRVLIDDALDVTRLYENYLEFEGALPESLPTVVAQLNAGPGFVHHVGHGFYNNMSMGRGGFSATIPTVDALVNGPRYFFLYSINCTSSAIDFDAIGEHFLTNPNGGTVGSVGSTRFDFPGTSDSYDREFYRLMFWDGVTRAGEAAWRAKIPFVSAAEQDNAHRWTQFTLIYFGDPNTRFWTARPEPLSVTAPSSIPLGTAVIPVTVNSGGSPVANATVTLFRRGEVWESGSTDASGRVDLTVHPVSEGDLQFTVTAFNRVPFQNTIQVGAAAGAYPVVTSTVIDDAAANGNARLEASESASVRVSIRNAGTTTLTGIQVTASVDSASPVTVLESVAGPAVLAGEDEGVFAFPVDVSDSPDDLTRVPVVIAVQADQGMWALETVIDVSTPLLQMFDLVLTEVQGNGDGRPDPGETVDLVPVFINEGSGASTALTGTLTLLSGSGSVVTGSADLGAVEAGAFESPDGAEPFTLILGSAPPELELRVVDEAGVSRIHAVLDIDAPAPVTGLIVSGGESVIGLIWEASPEADLSRYVIYRSENETGPFQRISGFAESPFAFYQDESLPPLAIRYYRIAAQDSSGNQSAPSPVVRGTTTVPLESNFPLESEIGTTTSMLVADLDADGVLDIVCGGHEIFAFHGDGSELIDGDTDARTLGVWSDTETSQGWWGPPAAGDLDGDGRLELVAVSFVEGLVGVWDRRGAMLPGWPRGTGRSPGSTVLGAPVLTDVDGDGFLDIVVHSDRALYAFDRFGHEVRDGDDNPATDGVFFNTASGFSFATPAAYDFDGDGRAELAVAVRDSALYLIDDDSTVFPGFPVKFNGEVTSSPAIADLDGDQVPEIILATGADSLEVLRADGTRYPGWPQFVLMNQDFMSSPAVGDLDGDGLLEIAVISGNTTVHVWDRNGVLLEGFTKRFFDPVGLGMAARGSPSIGNIDEDDDLEVVFSNQEGLVFAVNRDGSLAEGFPLKISSAIEGGVMVYDVDGDGINELGFAGLDRNIYLYETLGRVVPGNPGWPMFHHNPRRTGVYGETVLDGRTPRVSLAVLQTDQLPDRVSLYAVSTWPWDGTPQLRLDDAPLTAVAVDGDEFVHRAVSNLSPGTHQFRVTGSTIIGEDVDRQRMFDAIAPPAAPGWIEAPSAGVAMWTDSPAGWPPVLLAQRVDGSVSASGWEPEGDGIRVQVGPVGYRVPSGTRLAFDLPPSWTGGRVDGWNGTVWVAIDVLESGPGRVLTAPERLGWFRLTEGTPIVTTPGFRVSAAHPNPSAASTAIEFTLGSAAEVFGAVFDVRGRRITTLAGGEYPAGTHRLVWDGRGADGRSTAPGIFFMRVTAGGQAHVRKIVRLAGGSNQ